MTETRKHPLRGLLVAQFFGAFNDNAWKLSVAFLAMRAVETELEKQTQITLAFVALTVPLILFSLPAGVLADRISKRSVILSMKALEVALMAAATVVLLLFNPADPADGLGRVLALVVLGLMGVQSALFSPAKYGILPEILPHTRLSSGNAQLQMWTMLAIIGGTAAAGALLAVTVTRVWLLGAALTGFARRRAHGNQTNRFSDKNRRAVETPFRRLPC